MKITLTYEYSKLDKQHQFGVSTERINVWTQWIWFALGRHLKGKKVHLYPYEVGRVIKEYEENKTRIYPATFYGKELAKIILKKLKKVT